jgi:hypothetical protein
MDCGSSKIGVHRQYQDENKDTLAAEYTGLLAKPK